MRPDQCLTASSASSGTLGIRRPESGRFRLRVRLFWRDRDGQDGSGQISRNHGTFGSQPVAVPSEERVNPGSRPSAVTPGLDSAAAPDRAKRGATAPSATRIARNSGDSASLQESRPLTAPERLLAPSMSASASVLTLPDESAPSRGSAVQSQSAAGHGKQ